MEVLNPEERQALKKLYDSPDVVLAVFPSATQLDTEVMDKVIARFSQYGVQLGQELTTLLRLPSRAFPAYSAAVSRGQLGQGSEESFYSAAGKNKEIPIVISLPRNFCASLCERLFGAPMAVSTDRALVASEQTILRDLIADWAAFLGVTLGGGPLTLNEAPRVEDPTEGWLRIECPLSCGAVEGAVRIGLPLTGVRKLFSGGEVAMSAGVDQLCERLGEIPLELHAVLGQAEFSLDALTCLRIGDVITLDRHAEDLVDVQLDNRVLLRARAGLSGQNVVLEVVSEPKEREN